MISKKESFMDVLNNYELSYDEVANFASKLCQISKRENNNNTTYFILSPSFIPKDIFKMAVEKIIKDNELQNIEGDIEFTINGDYRIAKFTVTNVPYSHYYTINRIADTNTYAITGKYGKVKTAFIVDFVRSKNVKNYTTHMISELENTVLVTLHY